MPQDSALPFVLPAVSRKRVVVAFDGGRLSSDGGVLLLSQVERRLGIADRLAACLRDRRDPERTQHTLAEMLRLRMFAIAAGYEDANDCDALRHDPAFKLALGRAPESGRPLCSQPTVSRLENAPSRTAVARMMAALVDLFCASFPKPPQAITLDLDETCDVAHGRQQLSLFNGHYDSHCFLPIHVYEAATGRPVTVLFRRGATPTGTEIRTLVRHLVGRLRRHWPQVRITLRGDSHYGRQEVMTWCEDNGVDYVFGLGGNRVLAALVRDQAEEVCVRRALDQVETLRRYAAGRYAARSWHRQRTVVARIEASGKGLDVRYVVTSLPGPAEMLYEAVYCARGQMENFIKLHKRQSASDRTSCGSPTANQVRLILHTAAYWLLLTLREAIPAGMPLRQAEPGRVHHAAVAAGQAGRPHRRDRHAPARPPADRLPGPGLARPAGDPLRRRAALSGGALMPRSPVPSTGPNACPTSTPRCTQSGATGRRVPSTTKARYNRHRAGSGPRHE